MSWRTIRQVMKRLVLAAIVVSLPPLIRPAHACSAIACVGGGPEFRRSFAVVVKHDGKPLSGVKIEIKAYAQDADTVTFTGTTGVDGKAAIANLPPGNYWLTAELLGIDAVNECFHVAGRASTRAKRTVKSDWGELAPATRRVAGTLIDSQPGTGEGPLWNMVHRVGVPVDGAALRLENAVTHETFGKLSASDGSFAFDAIPDGTYVLHVEGGRTGRTYGPEDLLIEISGSATKDSIMLIRREASGGSCGGTQIELLPLQRAKEPLATDKRR